MTWTCRPAACSGRINAYLLALAAPFAFGGEQLSQSGFWPI